MSESADERTRRVLRENGLPEGLLPRDIVAADISDSGAFSVQLARRVDRKHGPYPVRFHTRISGVLAPGRVSQLRGVQAKQLVWLTVNAITADADELIFTVGPAKRRLPRTAFP